MIYQLIEVHRAQDLQPCRVGSVSSVSASRTVGRELPPSGSYQRPS